MPNQMTYIETRRRLLDTYLKEILGSNNVYYQPPETQKINYPAIIFSLYDIDRNDADNKVYTRNIKFRVVLVCKEPNSHLIDSLSLFDTANFERHYVSNNLNHYVYTIYC